MIRKLISNQNLQTKKKAQDQMAPLVNSTMYLNKN